MSYFDRSILFLKGMAMGVSDLIPGISGGTVALLLGIYKNFISSLKSINFLTVTYLFQLNFKKLDAQINFNFLITVFLGIITSIFIFSNLISHLLVNQKILLFSFFFGLILFSSVKLIVNLSPRSFYDFLYIILGISIGISILFVNPLSTSDNFLSIFISGFVAISAMLLPGISGSYILLLLGKYQFMLDSISNLKITNIIVFTLGAIIGLLSFSKIIHWLIDKFYRPTIFFLGGLMLGALNKVWPWQVNDDIVFPFGDATELILSTIFFIVSGLISFYLKSK
tara:strand:- start:396 stop:1244 length:849 start_codon:yes stop_codon:yes gene_type:complete